jgi:hypothetical protein
VACFSRFDCSFKASEERVVSALNRSFVDNFVETFNLQNIVTPEWIESAKRSDDSLNVLTQGIADLSSRAGSDPQRMAEFFSIIGPKWVSDTVAFLRQWKQITKLCSFSAINDSILMWSHYADNHRGFCVEYDLERLQPEHFFRRSLYPIIYSDCLYDLTGFCEKLVGSSRDKFSPMSPLVPLLHKFQGWSYEQEWRLVWTNPIPRQDFDSRAPNPTVVFLGSKMAEGTRRELIEICERKKINVRQMVLSSDRFELLSE